MALTISYQLTEADYIDAQRMHAWRNYKPSTAAFVMQWSPYLGVVFLLMASVILLNGGPEWLAWIELVGGLYMTLSGVLARYLLGRRFRATHAAVTTTTIRFDDDVISVEGPKASSRIDYSGIQNIVQTRGNIMLYLAPAVFIPVPRRALTPEQQGELANLLDVKRNVRR